MHTLSNFATEDGHVHHGDHHDDFGGLHRDLLQIGTTMDSRNALRFATRLRMGLGALSVAWSVAAGLTATLSVGVSA